VPKSNYLYDQAWEGERARLAGLESLWDPGTRSELAASGVGNGARVLEAGAGGGSIVEWLASVVGAHGRVLAVDLDVRFVEALRSDVVRVQQLDLVTGELPEGEFDLVHSRLVLEHLTDRDVVLTKLMRALRPGGTLVVEDYDWTGFGIESADSVEQRAADAILQLMAAAGFDSTYGRKVVGAMASAGLQRVEGHGRSLVIDSSHPGFAFFRLSFEQLAPQAVQAGLITPEEAAVVGERLRSSNTLRVITPTLVAAIGRRQA
jgi:ubiquinone/menaquinone biosynthesis C-methylase UbiE